MSEEREKEEEENVSASGISQLSGTSTGRE
jgi:hypothetical protein